MGEIRFFFVIIFKLRGSGRFLFVGDLKLKLIVYYLAMSII